MGAVFLDRDGTINHEVSYLSEPQQMKLLPRAAQAIASLKGAGFLVIIVTNQGGLFGRGLINEPELDEIHALLVRRLAKNKATVDAIYYCPHHPDAPLKRYRRLCSCRKPNIGMIRQALKEFKIDIKKSFIVGDRTGDILAGKRAKITTILVKTGVAGKDKKYKVKPDFTVKDLPAAAALIKKIEYGET